MFIGHYAVALGAKRAAPALSLGTAFMAAQWLDLVWPVLVLAGVERVAVDPSATRMTPLDFAYYPWSHGLLMVGGWALLFAGAVGWHTRRIRPTATVAVLVLSHWALDALVHRPDLPLWLDGPKWGLGLWNAPTAAILLELGFFAVGLGLYLAASPPYIRRRWRLWSLVAFLLAVYFLNVFGPKPPADTPGTALAAPALAMWLLVAWAYWADRPAPRGGPAS